MNILSEIEQVKTEITRLQARLKELETLRLYESEIETYKVKVDAYAAEYDKNVGIKVGTAAHSEPL